jgi:hypothetical protein
MKGRDMETRSIGGGIARLDSNGGDGDARYRPHYRLVDLKGHEIARIYRDEALKEDDVLELDGQRWKVCSQVGASARVTRL